MKWSKSTLKREIDWKFCALTFFPSCILTLGFDLLFSLAEGMEAEKALVILQERFKMDGRKWGIIIASKCTSWKCSILFWPTHPNGWLVVSFILEVEIPCSWCYWCWWWSLCIQIWVQSECPRAAGKKELRLHWKSSNLHPETRLAI